ncbi:MAG: prepilin-type N-terminal cleavage/methylation domain-containing protein [Phycisphaerales bacterium]|nr:MAG: prepilin-type N-terminal cleavage/methylation domain-containing protein [Phycisphaerales bacterium]
MNRATRTSRTGRRAFTLVELLVVVTVLAVVLIVMLPAFARILESSNYAAAVNATTATLDRAAQRGVDGGVVVLYDIHTERTTLLAVEIHSRDARIADRPAYAYRPVPGVAPVVLPRNMLVYGLSFSVDTTPVSGGDPAWLNWYLGEREAGSNTTTNNWIFPRNHPQFVLTDYNPRNPQDTNAPGNAGNTTPVTGDAPTQHRLAFAESFFIPFDANGRALGAAAFSAGVRDAYLEFPDLPYEPDDPRVPTDNPTRFDPWVYTPRVTTGASAHPPIFNPEVRLRPAERLAIVDAQRLIGETGVRAPWFVRADATHMITPSDKQTHRDDDAVARVSRWIDVNAEILAIQSNSGKVVRRR